MAVCFCHVTYTFHSEFTLNSLAKGLGVRLRTKWYWVRVQLQSLKNVWFNMFKNVWFNMYGAGLGQINDLSEKIKVY